MHCMQPYIQAIGLFWDIMIISKNTKGEKTAVDFIRHSFPARVWISVV